MVRSRGFVTRTQGLFCPLVLPSLVLKCRGDNERQLVKGWGVQGGKKIHLNGKLQTRWKQFIPSEGSLQACSGTQHFGGGEAGNYRFPDSQRQPFQDGNSIQHLGILRLLRDCGRQLEPPLGDQHSSWNSLHQNSEPSWVITFHLAGAFPAPSPQLYQTRQTPESEFI